MQQFDIEHYRRNGYFEESGIIRAHFRVFRDVAEELKVILLVRKGSRACLPWIQRGYPAKPMTINLSKTSQRTGKVTCDSSHGPVAEQIAQAHSAGYYVLQIADGGTLAAINPRQREQPELAKEFPPGTNEQNERGQVIEPDSGLALTGDYDLMAVIGAQPAKFAGTNPSGSSKIPTAKNAPRYERTNQLSTLVISKLNGRFGRRRIMHGPHDLKYRLDQHNAGGCSAFFPDGRLYLLPTVDDVKDFYDRGLHQSSTYVGSDNFT